nr:hypothetical protein CFP56_04440 [Quercus suber]
MIPVLTSKLASRGRSIRTTPNFVCQYGARAVCLIVANIYHFLVTASTCIPGRDMIPQLRCCFRRIIRLLCQFVAAVPVDHDHQLALSYAPTDMANPGDRPMRAALQQSNPCKYLYMLYRVVANRDAAIVLSRRVQWTTSLPKS